MVVAHLSQNNLIYNSHKNSNKEGETLALKEENTLMSINFEEILNEFENELIMLNKAIPEQSTQSYSNSDEDEQSCKERKSDQTNELYELWNNHQQPSCEISRKGSDYVKKTSVNKLNSTFKSIIKEFKNYDKYNINKNIKRGNKIKNLKIFFPGKDTSNKIDNIKESIIQPQLFDSDDIVGANAKIEDFNLKLNCENGDKQACKYLNKQSFDCILSKIEVKLKNYLKEEKSKNIFESKTFESFISEDKFLSPTSHLTPKVQTPSIIKNFFEDQEVIEITAKKRHSITGEVLKERLEKLKEMEFKPKCFSNYLEANFIEKQKELARKYSNVSDFSFNISGERSFSNTNSNSQNQIEESISNFENVAKSTPVKFSKRGSILLEKN